MPHLTPDVKSEIVSALNARGAVKDCPRCGNSHFTLGDDLFAHIVQTDLPNLELSGRIVPFVIVFCTQCGYMAEHSLGMLGFMHLVEKKTEQGNADQP